MAAKNPYLRIDAMVETKIFGKLKRNWYKDCLWCDRPIFDMGVDNMHVACYEDCCLEDLDDVDLSGFPALTAALSQLSGPIFTVGNDTSMDDAEPSDGLIDDHKDRMAVYAERWANGQDLYTGRKLTEGEMYQ